MFNVYVKRNRSSSSSRSHKNIVFKISTPLSSAVALLSAADRKKKSSADSYDVVHGFNVLLFNGVQSCTQQSTEWRALSALNFARRILPSLDWATSLRLKDKSGMLAQL